MKEKEGLLCRLCLRTVPNEIFEEINETIKEILEVLQLKINYHINKECVVCSDCMGNIQECLDFKSVYLDAEDSIFPLYNSESEPKLDLREVYVHKNKHMTVADIDIDEEICRFCMKLNKSSSCKPLIEIEKDMLEKYIPELNFNLTNEPVICDSCLNSLTSYFRFLQTCMAAEEKIIKDCKCETTDNEDQIDLNDVARFTGNVLKYETEEDNIETGIVVAKDDAGFDAENVESDVDTDIDVTKTKRSFNADTPRHRSSGITLFNCDQCSFKSKYKESLKTHMLIHRDLSEVEAHKCKSCSYVSKRKNNLTRHIRRHHSSELPLYSCHQCSFTTKYKSSLKAHMLVHRQLSEITVYRCRSCPYVAKRKRALTRHTLLVHQDVKTLHSCHQCSFKSKYKHSVKTHMLVHRELSELASYECKSCPFVTKRKLSLEVHMLIHREPAEITMFNCDSCPFSTKREAHLKIHVRENHSPEAILYSCDQCSFTTKCKRQMKPHKLTHQELSEAKTYNCADCLFVTRHKYGLRRHMRRYHSSGVILHSCHRCLFKTKYKGSLIKHLSIHGEVPEGPAFECETCSFVTKTKEDLKLHAFEHESPDVTLYGCDRCSFKTKYKYCLKSHMLVHRELSKVALYNCGNCSFSTKYKKGLSRHMKNYHSPGVVLYDCNRCQFKAKFKGSLIKHMSIHQEPSEVQGVAPVPAAPLEGGT